MVELGKTSAHPDDHNEDFRCDDHVDGALHRILIQCEIMQTWGDEGSVDALKFHCLSPVKEWINVSASG